MYLNLKLMGYKVRKKITTPKRAKIQTFTKINISSLVK